MKHTGKIPILLRMNKNAEAVPCHFDLSWLNLVSGDILEGGNSSPFHCQSLGNCKSKFDFYLHDLTGFNLIF